MDNKPLVYVLLGAAGSGRRDVLADLITEGLAPEDRPAVLLAEGEAPAEADASLSGRLERWTWAGDGTIAATPPADATHVFFVTDGRSNPVDQIEALKPWLAGWGAELANVVCVVHCQLAEQHRVLVAWYDACVHFSDIVLLNRREGVANKWVSDFQSRYKDQFFPCVFEFVRDGRVKNPALVLEPQPRRMSHYFEDEPNWVLSDVDSGEEVSEDDALEGDEEVIARPEEDVFLARWPGGRRVKELPDIAPLLRASQESR